MIKLPQPISFQWDDGNKSKNLLKHKVTVLETEEAFFDKTKILLKDKLHSTDNEARFILLGKTQKERYLFVVFTLRKNLIRVISSRDMSKKERIIYEKKASVA